MAVTGMSFGEKIIRFYFNAVYNPAYDFTTARFARYRRLQERCIARLSFSQSGGKTLCVGVGTGNEITRILQKHPQAEITAVDYSELALKKAEQRALAAGKSITTRLMDVRQLVLEAESFKQAFCMHVMDFIDRPERATGEIIRVLEKQGEFVITFPSDNEGPGLGKALFQDSIDEDRSRGRNELAAYLAASVKMLMGFVYLPLYFRNKKRIYSRPELDRMLSDFKDVADFQVEEEPVYRDFIVYGKKKG